MRAGLLLRAPTPPTTTLALRRPTTTTAPPPPPLCRRLRRRFAAMAASTWSCEYVADAASGGTSSARYLAALDRFAAAASPAASSSSARFVVFTSDAGADGRYWCPDCVTAIPAVKRAAEKAGVSLLEVGVGDRAAWRGNAAHPFRAPPLSLTGVPTLVRLEGGGGQGAAVAARLGPELERAGTPEAAEKLAAAFFAAE